MHIRIRDEEDSALLSFLPYTSSFIACAVKEGRILIYWYIFGSVDETLVGAADRALLPCLLHILL